MAEKHDSAAPGSQAPAEKNQPTEPSGTKVREIDSADAQYPADPTADPTVPGTDNATGSAAADPRVKPLERYSFMVRSGAEAFGAFVLILGGVSISMFGGQAGVSSALGFGLILIAAIVAVGHISGGHFNPAVTLGYAVAGRMPWKDVLPYIVAQVIGGVLAMGLLWVVLSGSSPVAEQSRALFSSVSNGFGEHSPSTFPLTSVLLLEVILTAVFLGLILGATSSTANKALAPVAIGLTYAVIIQVALPIDGAGLNPARSTATVFFAEGWAVGQLWLFWVAPLAGAVIAGLIYRSFEPAPTETAGVSASTGFSTASAGEPATSADTVATAGNAGPAAGGSTTGSPATSAEAVATPGNNDADAQRFFDGDSKK